MIAVKEDRVPLHYDHSENFFTKSFTSLHSDSHSERCIMFIDYARLYKKQKSCDRLFFQLSINLIARRSCSCIEMNEWTAGGGLFVQVNVCLVERCSVCYLNKWLLVVSLFSHQGIAPCDQTVVHNIQFMQIITYFSQTGWHVEWMVNGEKTHVETLTERSQ